ncbi:hypothetical protein VQ042_11770 [Aurantimonas sp. A2-1-M11]|uniref:hypothetical protein n=1 Tax=Aurantimonas sp. A2-1-M11 TaxID=3113712 RepID=UPI002F94ADC1
MPAQFAVRGGIEPFPIPCVAYCDQQRVRQMFLFFSNGIGCMGSIIISIILSVLVMAILGVI